MRQSRLRLVSLHHRFGPKRCRDEIDVGAGTWQDQAAGRKHGLDRHRHRRRRMGIKEWHKARRLGAFPQKPGRDNRNAEPGQKSRPHGFGRINRHARRNINGLCSGPLSELPVRSHRRAREDDAVMVAQILRVCGRLRPAR